MNTQDTYKNRILEKTSTPSKFNDELSRSVLQQAKAEGIRVLFYALTAPREITRAPLSSR